MRIGIFTPYLDTLSGGEKYILSAASILAKGNDVSLFWSPEEEGEIKEKAEDKLGIELTHIKFVPNIFSKNTSFISRYLASRSYDRILLLSDGSIPLLGAKLLLHFQSPAEWVDVSSFKTKLKVGRVSRFICNSHFTKGYIDKKFNVKSVVLYPPVKIGTPDLKNKEEIILNVGRYGIHHAGSSYKKQEAMVEAFKLMHKQDIKGWKLVFVVSVGAEKELDDIKKQSEGFPIEFIINPKNSLLWDFYEKAKIYWHAAGFGEDLEKHPDRAEHFGISTVEAMGMGAVPIVINAGGQKEIVENNKNGLLWNTLEELTSLTKSVMQNSKRQDELSIAARERARMFSIDRFERELLMLVNE